MFWAFVDYENVGSLEALNIAEYEKIYVFCGPKNTRITFGSLPPEGFCSIELIGVATMGANNLDFRIAFHMGRFHEIADKAIAFHIVSNDTGFNGLVNHLKKIGRKCKTVSTNAPHVAKTKSPELSECASIVMSKLSKLDGRKRPRKPPKFLNWVKSQCQGLANSPERQAIFEELVKANIVQETESNISYEFGR
jgi:hypothetical protein